MAWTVTLNGTVFDTDDMTLGELGEVEAATGKPWSLLNPWTNVPTARELCRLALSRQGLSGDDLSAAVDGLTARDVKSAFDFRADEPLPAVDGEADAAPLDPSSRSSSPGARGGFGGGRAKQGKSA
jgi:hypothetical protein